MVDVIVYHDCCHDGLTAACVALLRYPFADLFPAGYSNPPDTESLRGKDVLVVDYSWKRDAMLAIANNARSIRVFDHHKTAEAELAGLDFCVFDMQRSGAGITWDELFPEEKRPTLVDYVEDRDLWRFALPNSREVHAACDSYPSTIETRLSLMSTDIDQLASEGRAILRYHEKLVGQALEERPRENIAGYNVPCVALPVISMRSDVAGRLSEGEPFAATYTLRADGSRIFSLRSRGDGVDVSEVAERFGGGGHKHAAGFILPNGASLLPQSDKG